jgi:hypothetical protein
MLWNSGRRISAAAYGSVFRNSTGILPSPADFPFFIAFIASTVSPFEGSLVLIGNSGGNHTGFSLSVREVEVLNIYRETLLIS